MSHTVKIKTEVRCLESLRAACSRQSLAAPVAGTHQLYDRQVQGYGVCLQDWLLPVVFDLELGETKFDNYGGKWGEQSRLDSFLQAYAVEKTKIEARRSGHTVVEQPQDDGSIKLTVSLG